MYKLLQFRPGNAAVWDKPELLFSFPSSANRSYLILRRSFLYTDFEQDYCAVKNAGQICFIALNKIMIKHRKFTMIICQGKWGSRQMCNIKRIARQFTLIRLTAYAKRSEIKPHAASLPRLDMPQVSDYKNRTVIGFWYSSIRDISFV